MSLHKVSGSSLFCPQAPDTRRLGPRSCRGEAADSQPRPLKGATAETNMHKSTRRRSHRELCNDQTNRLAPDGSPRMDECTYSTVSAIQTEKHSAGETRSGGPRCNLLCSVHVSEPLRYDNCFGRSVSCVPCASSSHCRQTGQQTRQRLVCAWIDVAYPFSVDGPSSGFVINGHGVAWPLSQPITREFSHLRPHSYKGSQVDS